MAKTTKRGKAGQKPAKASGPVRPLRGDAGWVSVAEAAEFIGITPAGFRSSLMPLLPPDAIRRQKPAAVHGPAVVEVVTRREVEAVARRVSQAEVSTGGTPLEEMRKWEAKRRELKYHQESGAMVDLADVDRGFMSIAEVLRRAGEAIRIEYGDNAAKILTNAWEDVRAKIDVLFALGDDRA